MNRHAYLIIAHEQFEILKIALSILDSEYHDFFIHIDRRSQNADLESIRSVVKKSKLTFVERKKITWGGYSQIQCELDLLKASLAGGYHFYHLLSGVDLPLKSANEIYHFFESHSGKEFVQFSSQSFLMDPYTCERIGLYHFLQDIVGRKKGFWYCLEKGLLKLQRILKVDRLSSSGLCLKGGANWFSITRETAALVVSYESWIRKHFQFSLCADELFLQTLLYESYKDALPSILYSSADDASACVRLIDWKRGSPYTFTASDFEEILASDCMFARKFNWHSDPEICRILRDRVLKSNAE